MPMDIDVLESRTGLSKKGNKYTIALVRLPAGDGRVGKIFSDVELSVADNVAVVLAVEPNTEMFLTPRVKSLAE